MAKTLTDIWSYFSSNYYNGEKYSQIRSIDFAGCEMVKSAYGNENSNYNWTIDHIFPKNSSFAKVFGSNDITNCQVLSLEANQQKANRLFGTSFW
ncbi:MAG: hypothetical protein K2L64_03530 [Ureaplasma sp.]|nr:hypothetical protein [Ureaplasma sp.]